MRRNATPPAAIPMIAPRDSVGLGLAAAAARVGDEEALENIVAGEGGDAAMEIGGEREGTTAEVDVVGRLEAPLVCVALELPLVRVEPCESGGVEVPVLEEVGVESTAVLCADEREVGVSGVDVDGAGEVLCGGFEDVVGRVLPDDDVVRGRVD